MQATTHQWLLCV